MENKSKRKKTIKKSTQNIFKTNSYKHSELFKKNKKKLF